MPRRNRLRSTMRLQPETHTPLHDPTTEEMARDLVQRGLASALILDRPFITQRDLAS